MDEDLKQRIVDYFTPAELVDFLLADDDTDAMHQLVEHLWDYIEDNIEEVIEEMTYGR
jgi:DNA-binding transcriptional regulator PaaX